MNKDKKNIESLVKNAFESFEAEVNPDAWSTIHNKLSSLPKTSVDGDIVSKGGYSSYGSFVKIALSIVSAAAIIATAVVLLNNEPNTESAAEGKNHIVTQNGASSNVSNDLSADHVEGDFYRNSEGNTDVSGSKESAEDIENNVNDKKNKGLVASYEKGFTESNSKAGLSDSRIIHDKVTTKENAENNNTSNLNQTDNNKEAPAVTSSNQRLAVIAVNQKSGCSPLLVQFQNTSASPLVRWNFGDVAPASSADKVEVTFNKPGKYTVYLSASDSKGKTESDSVTIIVYGADKTLVPNVFTPNADGTNDAFSISVESPVLLEAVVFDRSGNKIYNWNRQEGFWDGRLVNGSPAPEGTYFYRYNVVSENQTCTYQGFVTLMR